MTRARRRLLIGLGLTFLAGLVVGWLYGNPVVGLLVAALLAVGWQVRQLFAFEKAVRTGDYASLRYGEGISSQVFAQMDYLRQRGHKYKRRYRRLLKEIRESTEAIPDGGIVMNSDYEILTCNRAAQKLVGFKPRQDRGQRVDNILRDPKFAKYLKSERSDRAIEIRSPVRDGYWLNVRLVPFGGSQFLLFIRDVTERKRLNRVRREFIANASHELRTPLTVISGYLDSLVAEEDIPQTWRKPILDMHQQADRMSRIIAEMLELLRLEAATTKGREERVDVCSLLAAAAKTYTQQSDTAEIDIQCESRAALTGSESEIESIIVNLLSNALRHTPPDGKVTMKWSSDQEGGELSVSDTGAGVEEENIPRLTERFFRVDSGRSREDGGVGLGLAIVKHALARHGAELEIHSELGKGSSFVCRFPPDRLVSGAVPDLEVEPADHPL